MSWWRGFADRIVHDAPLAPCTWFRVGGPARYLFRPSGADDLAALMVRARDENVPVKVLGRGANVLVSDGGFDGVVVRLISDAFRGVQRSGTTFDVGAGVDLMPFARDVSRDGFSGVEGLAGIPGTIGGAVRMNAGGRFGDMADTVRRITVLQADGSVEEWPHDRIGFGYRQSRVDDRIVLSARLELGEENPKETAERFETCFQSKMASQPISDQSAGCIFKNPEGESAGAMIDRAGLKGTRSGCAEVSHRHANFIVAHEGATASDILRLIDIVRERVRSVFDTELDLEVDVWRPATADITA